MNLGRLGRHAEATELFRHVLHCMERALGPEHPDTLRCSGHLASLREQGQHAEAAQCLQRTLDAMQRVQGRDHADTLRTSHVLDVLLGQLGQQSRRQPIARVARLADRMSCFVATQGVARQLCVRERRSNLKLSCETHDSAPISVCVSSSSNCPCNPPHHALATPLKQRYYTTYGYLLTTQNDTYALRKSIQHQHKFVCANKQARGILLRAEPLPP